MGLGSKGSQRLTQLEGHGSSEGNAVCGGVACRVFDWERWW